MIKTNKMNHRKIVKSILIYGLIFIVLFFGFYFLLNYKSYSQQIRYKYSGNKQPLRITLPEVSNAKPDDEVNLSDRLIIEKIGVNASIIWKVSDNDALKRLNDGIIHFESTPLPSEGGNTVLTGHSSSYFWQKTEYGQVFALLSNLQKGDQIIIIYQKKKYVYQVYDQKIVSANDVGILQNKEPSLTLVTCWPVGTTLKRFTVMSKMIQKPNPSPPPLTELMLPPSAP